jgi:plastocyanin
LEKKIILIGIILAIVVVSIIGASMGGESEVLREEEVVIDADVIMPTKVSRPGCEETDSCYIPSIITAKPGEEITWINEDSAFHSVTSGSYDEPTDMFDSGYLDPYQSFSLSFEEKGTYDYFCTLHPWMKGQVIIE